MDAEEGSPGTVDLQGFQEQVRLHHYVTRWASEEAEAFRCWVKVTRRSSRKLGCKLRRFLKTR